MNQEYPVDPLHKIPALHQFFSLAGKMYQYQCLLAYRLKNYLLAGKLVI